MLIDRLLTTVSRRRRIQSVFDGLCLGLFCGTLLAAVSLAYRLFGGVPSIPLWLFATLGTLFGGFFGTLRPLHIKDSARCIDTHYRLKDRFLTALQLLRRPSDNPIERLQLEDTTQHALQVDPKAVAPFRRPWQLLPSLATMLFAIVFCQIPISDNRANTIPSTLSELSAVIKQIDDLLAKTVAGLLPQDPDEPELQSLVDELKRLSKLLEENSSDPKEVLATLSRMEANLAKMINELNLQAIDALMQEVAESLLSAEATRAAALALKGENYAEAADKLEKIDFTELSDSERNAVATKLRENAADASLRKLPNLDKLINELAEQLKEEVESPSAVGELAELCRTQELRKGISQELNAQLGLLEISKMQMVADGQGNKAGDSTSPSDSPSNQWGAGSGGQPQGDQATDAVGKFQQEQLTGMLGTGPSEIEMMYSGEATDATTTRSYKDTYRDFQRTSEVVLESEPIPFGQRQMIRTYFERIRPKEN